MLWNPKLYASTLSLSLHSLKYDNIPHYKTIYPQVLNPYTYNDIHYFKFPIKLQYFSESHRYNLPGNRFKFNHDKHVSHLNLKDCQCYIKLYLEKNLILKVPNHIYNINQINTSRENKSLPEAKRFSNSI